MWTVIPAAAILLSQATQPPLSSNSGEWCFDRGQGARLCEQTEEACNKLREINTEIALSPCKAVEPAQIQVSPTEPPNPATQSPTRR